ANTIDHNPEYKGNSTDQVVLRNCRNVSLTGLILQHTRDASEPVGSSIEVRGCQNVNVAAIQVLNARVRGIVVQNSSIVRIADCTIRGRAGDMAYQAALAVDEQCRNVMVVNNFLGRGNGGDLELPRERGTATG